MQKRFILGVILFCSIHIIQCSDEEQSQNSRPATTTHELIFDCPAATRQQRSSPVVCFSPTTETHPTHPKRRPSQQRTKIVEQENVEQENVEQEKVGPEIAEPQIIPLTKELWLQIVEKRRQNANSSFRLQFESLSRFRPGVETSKWEVRTEIIYLRGIPHAILDPIV